MDFSEFNQTERGQTADWVWWGGIAIIALSTIAASVFFFAADENQMLISEEKKRIEFSDSVHTPRTKVKSQKLSSAIPGNVITTEQISYYPIKGETLHDVVLQMRVTGPKDRDGNVLRDYAGVAIPDYDWDIDWGIVKNECVLTKVSVSVNTEISVPEWTTPHFASLDEKSEWRRYSKALLKHERQHKKYHDDGARLLRKKLIKLPGQPTCAQLEEKMQRAYERIIDDVRARNERFDCREYKCGRPAAWTQIRYEPTS